MTTQLLSQSFDQSKMETFAEQLLTLFNGGALSIMISIGHRTGLFDVLATLPPSTSQQIAEVANLQERYVREWLNALVVGRIVDYFSSDKTYHLSAEHAALLTRSGSPNNLAVFAQGIPMLAVVEEQIIDCFHRGGGIPYSQFNRFHEFMAEDSGQSIVAVGIPYSYG